MKCIVGHQLANAAELDSMANYVSIYPKAGTGLLYS